MLKQVEQKQLADKLVQEQLEVGSHMCDNCGGHVNPRGGERLTEDQTPSLHAARLSVLEEHPETHPGVRQQAPPNAKRSTAQRASGGL